MQKRCFPLYMLNVIVRTPVDRVESYDCTMEIEKDAQEVVDALLEPWELNADKLFMALNITFRRTKSWPWAIAFYEKEFRVGGHVISLRKHKEDFLFSSYSISPAGKSINQNGVPAFSILIINNRSAFAMAAENSPLLASAWTLLKDKSPQSNWLCIPESPSDAWVASTSVGDDKLFLESIAKKDNKKSLSE